MTVKDLGPTLYAWPDGWRVVFSPSRWKERGLNGPLVSYLFLELLGPRHAEARFILETHDHGRFASFPSYGKSSRDRLFDPELTAPGRKKLTGFVVDVGADRPKDTSCLVVPSGYTGWDARPSVPWPNWVPDERWEGRYEEIYEYVGQTWKGGYLGVVGSLEIEGESSGHFQVRWKNERRVFPSLDLVVDWLCHRYMIRPESERAAWEAENVERGSFIVPTDEEVEVYRMLGEPLPLWWGEEAFEPWLRERT